MYVLCTFVLLYFCTFVLVVLVNRSRGCSYANSARDAGNVAL